MTHQPLTLGIDLGTSRLHVALAERGALIPLWLDADRTGSLLPEVALTPEGTILTGSAAATLIRADPQRSLGNLRGLLDQRQVSAGGRAILAETLVACVLTQICQEVERLFGRPPHALVLAVPARLPPLQRDTLSGAAQAAGLAAELLDDALAAAHWYARWAAEPAPAFELVADLGFEALRLAVVARDDQGARIIGHPAELGGSGGVALDRALLAQLRPQLSPSTVALIAPANRSLPALRARRVIQTWLGHIRQRVAAEGSCEDIDPFAPDTVVTVTRHDIEALARPLFEPAIPACQRLIETCGCKLEQIGRVLLAGGGASDPLARATLALLGPSVLAYPHPERCLCQGAALSALSTAHPAQPEAPPRPRIANRPYEVRGW